MIVLDRRTVRAPRAFRGLGDTPPAQCQGQQLVRGVGTTDYACGFLRGWIRIFTRAGFPISIDPRSQNPDSTTPVGPAPSMQEWADFDATAAQMGVGGLTAQLRKNATPDQGFLAQVSRGLSTTGRGLEAGQLDKALKGASQTLVAVGAPVDKLVPGAGAVLENAILALLAPALLPSSIAGLSVSSTLPLAGSALSGAGSVAETFAAPSVGTIATGATGEEAVGVYDPLSSFFGQSQDVARVAGGAKGTLAKGETIITGSGSLAEKLQAVGLEAFNELQFAVSVVTLVGGGVALEGVSLAMTALKGAFTVGNALRAADALKKSAAVARAKALADEATLDKQISDLQSEIARVRAETAALSQRGATSTAQPSAPAKALGLALLAGVVIEVLS